MSADFDWRVEEEGDEWDGQVQGPRPDQPGRRPQLVLMVLLLLAGVVGAVVYRQAESRVTEAQSNVEAEVLALQQLIEQLAQRGDEELFRSLLSGRDQSWAETQSRLLLSRNLLDRPAFGLRLQPTDSPTQIEISPDLNAANVVSKRSFLAVLSDGRMQQVSLRQTAIFRRGNERWLYSPPLQEFWGDWQTHQESQLTLVYPARDQAVAVRLATDLNDKLIELCRAMPDINCPYDWHVWLRLETDPESLLAAADLESLIRSSYVIKLPTPTLVGLPVDELAYQALFRGYGSQLLSALIPQLVDYQCCWRGQFFRAILDKQLSQLDMAPWPLTRAEYDWLLRRPFRWTNVFDLWNNGSVEPGDNWQQVYSLIDFMLGKGGPATKLAQMQRGLLTVPGSYVSWVGAFLPDENEANRLSIDWLRFVYGQTTSGRMVSPPISLPEQDIQLLCGIGSRQAATLYQYDLPTGRRDAVFTRDDLFGLISPLANGDYLVNQRVFNSDRVDSRTMLWHGEDEILVSEALKGQFDSRRGLYFAGEDPTGRYGVLVAFGNPGQPDQFQLLDLNRCTASGCQLLSLRSLPVWSSDGNRTLQVDRSLMMIPGRVPYDQQLQIPVYLGDDRGQARRLIGLGNLPFWVGDGSYGYLRLSGTDSQSRTEVVIATAGSDPLPTVLLRPAELMEAIPPAERPPQLFILSISTQPKASRFLAITASALPEREAGPVFTFLVELTADVSRINNVSLKHTGERSARASFSPSGQWLTVFANEGSGNLIHLFDLESDKSTTIGSNGRWAGWSGDGLWVAQRYDYYLTLLAPAHDYQQIIFQDFSNCRAIGWGSGS